MKNEKGIITPLGIVPRKLAHSVMSQGGIKFVGGRWVVLTDELIQVKTQGKIGNCWLPIRMYNMEIALSQSRIRHNSPSNTEEVVQYALDNHQGKEYLPKKMGFSSYSKLCEYINTQERNFFSLRRFNQKKLL